MEISELRSPKYSILFYYSVVFGLVTQFAWNISSCYFLFLRAQSSERNHINAVAFRIRSSHAASVKDMVVHVIEELSLQKKGIINEMISDF